MEKPFKKKIRDYWGVERWEKAGDLEGNEMLGEKIKDTTKEFLIKKYKSKFPGSTEPKQKNRPIQL